MHLNGLHITAARLLSLLYPCGCRLCCAPTGGLPLLCQACEDDLPWLGAGCVRCSLPLTSSGALCGQCQRQSPDFDSTLALFRYQPPLDFLVKRMKFSSELAICRFFAYLLAARIEHSCTRLPDVIIPVPLHYTRLRERGFNQSSLLARHLGRALDIQVDRRICIRTRSTEPQSSLPRARRGSNLRGAFEVRGTLPAGRVAVVDDVMTTGHTCNELAATLKRAGAEQVQVWVIARADSKGRTR